MRLSSRGPVALAAAAALAFVAGCGTYVPGNGVYASERRPLGDFQGVKVEDGVRVVATAGVPLEPVKVSGDQTVVPHIRTDLIHDPDFSGTTLHVWVDERYDPMIAPQVVVSVPSFQYVEGSDTSTVTVGGTGGDAIEAKLSGDSLLDATEYLTALARVDLSGTATAKINSSGAVTGTVANDSTLINVGVGHCDEVIKTSGNPTVSCN